MRSFFLICLLLLSACATTVPSTIGALPNSQRLEHIRIAKEKTLKTQLAARGLEYGSPILIRVFKEEGKLETWIKTAESEQYAPFKRYPICNFSGHLGPKLAEGDLQAPEGFYTVTADQLNPNSQFHLSFNLGFPNEYDQAYARTGSLLMIHGNCTSVGCYAMTDPAIEEIYLLAEASIAGGHDVPVHAFPFHMNAYNMYLHKGHKWEPFWQNLKQGYDAFERTKIPPKAGHHAGNYVFQNQEFKTASF